MVGGGATTGGEGGRRRAAAAAAYTSVGDEDPLSSATAADV